MAKLNLHTPFCNKLLVVDLLKSNRVHFAGGSKLNDVIAAHIIVA